MLNLVNKRVKSACSQTVPRERKEAVYLPVQSTEIGGQTRLQ